MTRSSLKLAISFAVPVVLLVLWWFASANSTNPFFPPLQTILQAFMETWVLDPEHLRNDLLPSLNRMFSGLGIALVLGVVVGIILGRLPQVEEAFNPTLQFGRSLPATALVPVGIVFLGIGDEPKIALIAFVTFFPILLSTIDGVRSLEPGLEDVAKSFRLSRRQHVMYVQLPSALPNVIAGLRIGLSVAFVMMVVTELVAATNGIGYVVLRAQLTYKIPEMWAGMLLLGLLGIVINGAFVLIEGRLLHWYKRTKAD